MHLITPALRDYAWGTTEDIAGLLGLEATGEPIAEAWWGGHHAAPSQAHIGAESVGLDALIAADPAGCVGAEAWERWGDRLPYLLKVLAIRAPLSIQVHPTLEQARAGFQREQAADAGGEVTFHDTWHKPEMIVALTPMTVLAGVRPLEELRADLMTLGTPGARRLEACLTQDIAHYLRHVLDGEPDLETLAALAAHGARAPEGSSLRTSADALAHFPGDAGALVALALNVVELAPGEAVYTGAGTLHSYQSGVGVEIMANSDNVVRAGLTPKHVDIPLLLQLADTRPATPARPQVHRDGGVTRYVTDSEEFALTTLDDAEASFGPSPTIALVIEGEAQVESAATGSRPSSALTADRGEAVFARWEEGPLRVSASGTTVVAHLPAESASTAARIR